MPVVPVIWGAEAGELLETGEAEVAVSLNCATAFQPGWQSETPSKKKKNSITCYLRKNSSWWMTWVACHLLTILLCPSCPPHPRLSFLLVPILFRGLELTLRGWRGLRLHPGHPPFYSQLLSGSWRHRGERGSGKAQGDALEQDLRPL